MSERGEESRQDKRKSRTRSALLQAATTIALDEGVNISIQSITDKADVGFGSFYNHFASKEELFTAVAHESLHTWESETSQLLNSITDPLSRLASTLRLYVRMNKTHPDIAKILNRTAPEMIEYPFEYSSQFQLALEMLGKEKLIEISSVPLNVLAIRSTLKQVLAIREKNSKFTDKEADQVVEMMLIMMKIEPTVIKKVMSLPLPAVKKRT